MSVQFIVYPQELFVSYVIKFEQHIPSPRKLLSADINRQALTDILCQNRRPILLLLAKRLLNEL